MDLFWKRKSFVEGELWLRRDFFGIWLKTDSLRNSDSSTTHSYRCVRFMCIRCNQISTHRLTDIVILAPAMSLLNWGCGGSIDLVSDTHRPNYFRIQHTVQCHGVLTLRYGRHRETTPLLFYIMAVTLFNNHGCNTDKSDCNNLRDEH